LLAVPYELLILDGYWGGQQHQAHLELGLLPLGGYITFTFISKID
jgi:hypothetical protein